MTCWKCLSGAGRTGLIRLVGMGLAGLAGWSVWAGMGWCGLGWCGLVWLCDWLQSGALRDEFGGVVPDRKPGLRISLHLPASASASAPAPGLSGVGASAAAASTRRVGLAWPGLNYFSCFGDVTTSFAAPIHLHTTHACNNPHTDSHTFPSRSFKPPVNSIR